MAYENPFVAWNETVDPSPEDLNRIERNIRHLKSEAGSFEGVKTFTNGLADNTTVNGQFNCSAINTGEGVTNVFPMSQPLRDTDPVTFASVNTGQGATEVHLQNQNLRTNDTVSFNRLRITGRSEGSWNLGVGGSLTIPAGIYTVFLDSVMRIEVRIGGVWQILYSPGTPATADKGVVNSDGSNFRVRNASATISGVASYRIHS